MTTPTALADGRTASGPGPSPSGWSASLRRLNALARAELILLIRNRSAIFVALVLPIVMIFSIRASLEQIDLAGDRALRRGRRPHRRHRHRAGAGRLHEPRHRLRHPA